MTATAPWIQSRMPVSEEIQMFRRMKFWKHTALILGLMAALLLVALVWWQKVTIQSTAPRFRIEPQVEIMREPEQRKIDNRTRA